MTRTTRLTGLLLAGACLSCLPAAAQPATPAPADAQVAQAETGREEITVTATRRATPIQKTPIAITAVGSKALENASIRETQTLTALVPSLAFPQSESSGSVTARIRGVGTQGSNPGLESAVGIFIDGVYRSRNAVGFGDLGDIERVEVLRGPQGTLFGRNTSAGLISVITKQPSLTTTQFTASADYESFDGFYLTAGVTAPITEDVSGIRLFASYRKMDGYMDLLSGPGPSVRDGNKKESYAGRAQYLYKPDDSFSLRVIVDGAHRDDECCYAAILRPGSYGARGPTGPRVYTAIRQVLGYDGTAPFSTVHDQVGYSNRNIPQIIDEFGGSAEINYGSSWGNLTSITAYRDWKLSGGSDADYTSADILWTDPDVGFQHFKTFTQEFRLTGSTDWLDWLVGGFYSHENLTRETSTLDGTDTEAFLSIFNLGANPLTDRAVLGGVAAARPGSPAYNATLNPFALGTGLHDYYEQTAESFAIFTHNTIKINDELHLTLGGRYTTETKRVDATYRTNQGAGCAYEESIYGYNPAGVFAPGVGNAAGSSAPGATLFCLPWVRGALDALTASAPLHEKRTEDKFSGIATLDYQVTENLNVYATYSRGYKAGGFNLDRYFSTDNDTAAGSSIARCPDGSDGSPAQRNLAGVIIVPARPYTCARPTILVAPSLAFKPELVDAYELGAKSQLFDGKLTLNLALFYQDFTDYQLNTFTGISFVVTSVPEVISKGFELDATVFTDIDGLTLNGGIAYADTRYGKHLGDLDTPGSFIFENPNLFILPNSRLTSAPEWTLTGGFTYEAKISEGFNLLIHADDRHISTTRTGSNLDPAKTQKGYDIFNMRIGIATADDKYSLEFFAKNLFDKRYAQITFDAPVQGSSPTAFTAVTAGSVNATTPGGFSQIGAFLGEPRVLGATVKVKF